MRIVGAPAQTAAYAGDAVRALSVAPVLDDELEEEEAGGKGAAHRAIAARGSVSGCERDAVPPLTPSSQLLRAVALTNFEEMVPEHVECESSSGGNGMGKHEEDCIDESSSMGSRCRGRGEAP